MARWTVEIVAREEQAVYGLWARGSDRTIARDIAALSGRYCVAASLPRGGVLPFYVLSRDYDAQGGTFALLIGGAVERPGLARFVLPAGAYAKITVRPKLGFLWGAAVGEAKRYFYTRWLARQSAFRALNLEYEYHTEQSTARRPSVDLYFAVERA